MSAVAQGHRPVGTPSLGAWRGLFKQQWLFCLQAVTVFGSTNSYRISLAPASNLHGMNRILHLVSRLLSLPPVREVAWGPHVAARGVPFKAIRCCPSRDRPDCRAGFGPPSCSLKFTFLAVSQTRRRIPTPGPWHWQSLRLQCSPPTPAWLPPVPCRQVSLRGPLFSQRPAPAGCPHPPCAVPFLLHGTACLPPRRTVLWGLDFSLCSLPPTRARTSA